MTFSPLSVKEATETLLGLDDVIVLMHKNPDADTVGTAVALVRVLNALGKRAELAPPEKIPERLAFLVKDTPIATTLTGKAPVAVDIASPPQMGDLRASIGEVKLMIDHHEVGEPFAPFYIKKGASSAAEVLVDLIDELIACERITLTKDIAEPLFAAISSDTGSFKYSSVTPTTLRVAARLIECGIDHAHIAHKLFSEKTEAQIRAEGYIASRIKTLLDGKIAYATHTKEERDSIGATEEDFECAVDIVRALRGVMVAFVVRKTDKGGIRASLRSVGPDVAAVAKKLGGGGHVLAAGCSPETKDINEAVKMITDELVKLF